MARFLARRRLVLVLVLLFLLAAIAVIAVPRARRVVLVCWLHVGDWLSAEPPIRRAGDELVVFDAADGDDRKALGPTHGELARVYLEGRKVLRLVGSARDVNEVCTRRIPRDWSGHRVLRLEASEPSGGSCRRAPAARPLLLGLRTRGRPGWGETRWYRRRAYLEPGTTRLEVGIGPAASFIDLRQVRQLCLSLVREDPGSEPSVELRRIVLTDRWSADQESELGDAPVSVHLIGDSTKLRRFDPAPTADNGDEGAWFQLEAARNEVVAFQVVVRRGPRGPERARVELAPFGGPKGRQLRAELFEERTLRVREPSSAMYGWGRPGPGSYPDPLLPLRGSLRLWAGNRLVWVDLLVPEDAPAGTYTSTLRVLLSGREHPVERSLRLQVHPVTLPHHGRHLVMVGYATHLLRQTLDLPAASDKRFIALERAFHRLVHAHGAYLAADHSLRHLDRFLPILDGSLFTEGPGRGEGPPYWPVSMLGLDQGRAATQREAKQLMEWFHAHHLKVRPFLYLADEPGSREDYERIRRQAEWIHTAPAPGNGLPVMVTEQVAPDDPGWPSLTGAVDIWVSPRNFPEPARSRRARSKTERFFTYNGGEPMSGSQLLDADGVSLRTWGWIAFLFEIDLWYLWHGLYYMDEYNSGRRVDLFLEPVTFDQRRRGKDQAFGNGDGVIVYPPLRPGGQPLASVRLKMLRRGVQDRLYLLQAMACGAGARARSIARRLIPRALGEARGCPTSWPKSEAPWERARLELLRLLARCGE